MSSFDFNDSLYDGSQLNAIVCTLYVLENNMKTKKRYNLGCKTNFSTTVCTFYVPEKQKNDWWTLLGTYVSLSK